MGRSTNPATGYVDHLGRSLADYSGGNTDNDGQEAAGGKLVLSRKSASGGVANGRYIGPGHAGVFEYLDSSGARKAAFTFHWYDADECGVSKLGAREMSWDSNGWPVISDDPWDPLDVAKTTPNPTSRPTKAPTLNPTSVPTKSPTDLPTLASGSGDRCWSFSGDMTNMQPSNWLSPNNDIAFHLTFSRANEKKVVMNSKPSGSPWDSEVVLFVPFNGPTKVDVSYDMSTGFTVRLGDLAGNYGDVIYVFADRIPGPYVNPKNWLG